MKINLRAINAIAARNLVISVFALSFGAYALHQGQKQLASCALATCAALWLRSGKDGDGQGWTLPLNLSLSALGLAFGAYALAHDSEDLAAGALAAVSALWARSGRPLADPGTGPGGSGDAGGMTKITPQAPPVTDKGGMPLASAVLMPMRLVT